MKKLIVVVLLLAAAGGVAYAAWRQIQSTRKSGPGRGAMVIAVETALPRTTDIRDMASFTGTLEPRSRIEIASKVPGRLQKLLVQVGDEIAAGQLVAVLESDEFARQAEQAKAELDVAQASIEDCTNSLEQSRRELERAQALRDKKIASQAELDTIEAQHKACQARLKVAQAQVAQRQAAWQGSQVRLSYCRIEAAWAGGQEGAARRVVGERFVDEGAMLRANDPIVSVLDDRVLKAVIHAIERDYPKLRVAQEVRISADAFPGQSFGGKVVRIAPLLKESTRQGRVEIEVDNADRRLRSGMFIRAEIEFGRRSGVQVVPAQAVVTRGQKQGVFVVGPEDARAAFVPVVTGQPDGDSIEIVEPTLDKPVVALGQHLLQDGSAIRQGAGRGRGVGQNASAATSAPGVGSAPATEATR